MNIFNLFLYENVNILSIGNLQKRQKKYKNMNIDDLRKKIEDIWTAKQNGNNFDANEAILTAEAVINLLDNGKIKVAESSARKDKNSNKIWNINQWIKKAILLSFLKKNKIIRMEDGAMTTYFNKNGFDPLYFSAYRGYRDTQFKYRTDEDAFVDVVITNWFDKCENKFFGWSEKDFQESGVRAVPGCFVRKGAFLNSGCIVMPSFVNIGANIGKNTMIDSMTTIGSCAQIGANCHISANVCIGGVLEPLQANPVIIEDNCFVGAGCQITEGIIVHEGSVIATGVTLSSGVKIIDRATGKVFKNEIPPYSVVVSGSYKSENNLSINCAIIIKKITAEIRSKTSINDLLRC